MTWFKGDDQSWNDPRIGALTDLAGYETANAVWGEAHRAAIYCMAHMTDGLIPVSVFQQIAGPIDYEPHLKLARRVGFIAAGTRTNAMGGKCLFLPWVLEHNPTKEQHTTRLSRQRDLRDTDLKERVRLRDGDNCRYCGEWIKWTDRRGLHYGTFDHVDPAGTGFDNLVVACGNCNRRKGSRTPGDAGMTLLPPGKSKSEPKANLQHVVGLREVVSSTGRDGAGRASGLGSGAHAPTRRGSRGGKRHHSTSTPRSGTDSE